MAGQEKIPEIMIISDDEEPPPPAPVVSEPKQAEEAPALAPVENPKPSTPVTPAPAVDQGVLQNKSEVEKAPEQMAVDDNDSDLELIEEVPVQKSATITPKKESTPIPAAVQPAPIPPVKELAPVEALEVLVKKEEPPKEEVKPMKIEGNSPKKLDRKLKKILCCNIDCRMNNNQFVEAPLLTKSFFEVKNENKISMVCESCSRSVALFKEKCLDMLEKEQPIVNAVQYLPSKDMVVLDDSDEEISPEDLPDDDEKFEIDLDMVNEVFSDFELKYKISVQDEKCYESLLKSKASVEDDFAELDKELAKCYKTLDDCRAQIYNPWKPEATSIGSVDTEVDTQPGLTAYSAPVAYQKRKGAVAMKKVTQVHHARFSQPSTSRPPDDIIAEVPRAPIMATLVSQKVPPKGPFQSAAINIGDEVYGMKSGLYHEWLKGRVLEISQKNGEQLFKVKFLKTSSPNKNLNGRQIAYGEEAKYQFEVGHRVIALFHNPEESGSNKFLFYAGIIAECIKVTNNYRYLIFFDDGCTQYVPHDHVRLVCKRSVNVWDDCHPDIRDFIRNYLDMFPERPMVRLAVNQKVKTEWNTRWWLTRVKEVDCSLVLVHFEADNRTEWIYRGSQRLAPLYYEMQKKQMQKNSKVAVRLHRGLASNASRKNHAEIEYPRMLDDDDELSITFIDAHGQRQKVSRAVAKKSTVNRPFNNVVSLPDRRENFGETISENLGPGKWMNPVEVHNCSPKCITETENSYKEGDRVLCNPMLIPLNQGWGRETTTYRNTKLQVFYRGPCGRRMRNMQELMCYLRTTKSTLCADLFSFDPALRIESTFIVEKPLYSIKDISYGSENVKIPCVNTINHTEYPMYVNYSTARTPSAKTFINPDPGFLVCCDCIDDCQDKTKCACHKLTVDEAKILEPNQDPMKVGYNFRRLNLGGQQTTAIFECNQNCKCSENCLNRVVQHKMKSQLQTEKRGWGLRALNDIPAGTFLCIYAGQIMTEHEGNEEGKQFGDEYLAELDYIEVLERCKEGYESDVTDIEDADFDGSKCNEEESDDSNDGDLPGQAAEDKDFLTSISNIQVAEDSGEKRMSLRKRKEGQTEEQTNEEEHPGSPGMHKGEVKAPKGYNPEKEVTQLGKVSIRYLIDRSEDIYVMDAKSVGNLGRYFNHSCDPNVIVQNVFVDTHDLRFPWVAFFTKKHVPAGSELCWDYNYEIGSLPDRRLDCYCESANCRGRLL
ncbi:histone-lysine N-methyltransferase SETDB1 isoform X2 [Neocloeon triangulifer]|uniref:histone-lysine N-methyltransferase SETDB1 isoform X2 n=1 Tax=Neocloeon triangulifer TaxID=2078957 RepID=UPI00286F7C7E|nr:histone-lysine N-methyltransferase SETDB1 isoform X2 [Neocloeon triangulifer]